MRAFVSNSVLLKVVMTVCTAAAPSGHTVTLFNAADADVPLPPPPPLPSCVFTLPGHGTSGGAYTINLTGLPARWFTLKDTQGNGYSVVSPCRYADNTSAPAVEDDVPTLPGIPVIPLGYATALTVVPLPAVTGTVGGGMRLVFGNGDPVYCPGPRQVWYDMVCDTTVPPQNPPNSTMDISMHGRAGHCWYRVEWRTPLACSARPHPPPSPLPPKPTPPNSPAIPTSPQLRMMDTGLAQFMHFSVDTWSGIEHNCVPVGSGKCLPASLFNPSNLSTDQWVEAAVAMGAGEICLTAHHEGGFCLWDTKYTNYSVMHSPYGKDVVAQFVTSCKKYGVKPCFYMGPNANGYLMQNPPTDTNATAFVEAQLGMTRELLTNYGNGTDYVSRLWWDHYSPWPDGCSGDPNVACPQGSFPGAWSDFVALVREVSPTTIMCPGPDCDGHQGESSVGVYPTWYPCAPNSAPNTPPNPNNATMSCGNHAPSGSLAGFHPYETCGTLLDSGYFCRPGACGPFWSAREIWTHYMDSVGIGWVNTMNAPPGTDGQIPTGLVANMASFGAALTKLLAPVNNATASGAVQCSGDLATADALVLDISSAAALKFNMIKLEEDLSKGQRIASYAIDFLDGATGAWTAFAPCADPANCLPVSQGGGGSGGVIPPVTPVGTCGVVTPGENLVDHLPPSTHLAGMVDNATSCRALCAADKTCNFWTWHDLTNTPLWARKCYTRSDTVYDPVSQTGHTSGVCNHTLAPGVQKDGGVHGLSVGARVFDFVPEATTQKVRFRCTSSLASDGMAYIRCFSVHAGEAPPAPAPAPALDALNVLKWTRFAQARNRE